MPCLVGCLALLAPRLVLLGVAITSDYLGRAYESAVWPVIGFFLMPLTTLAYAWAINSHGEVKGFPFFIVLLAALLDLGLAGNGERARRRWRRDEDR